MHKVQVTDTGIDQRFKGRHGDALKDACPEQAPIGLAGSSPDASEQQHQTAEDIQMTLAPNACGGDDEGAGDANTTEMISGQERDGGKIAPKI